MSGVTRLPIPLIGQQDQPIGVVVLITAEFKPEFEKYSADTGLAGQSLAQHIGLLGMMALRKEMHKFYASKASREISKNETPGSGQGPGIGL